MKFNFKLGDFVEDKITGFTGIIMVCCQWLHNCNTYGVKSRELKDGIPGDNVYFDEPQLKIVEETILEAEQGTGGPCPNILQTNR